MEHLIYAPKSLYVILARLFNAILQVHYNSSSSFTKSIIVRSLMVVIKTPLFQLTTGVYLFPPTFQETTIQPCLLHLIHPLQGGFRPGYSTFHTSLVLNEAIAECKNNKSPVYIAFFDVQKAFDRVWYNVLF